MSQFWQQVEQACVKLSTTNYSHHGANYPTPCTTSLTSLLQAVSPVFETNAQVDACARALTQTDALLAPIQTSLEALVDTLQASLATADQTCQSFHSTHEQLRTLADITTHLDIFCQQVHIPSSLQTSIEQADVHGEQFQNSLAALSTKLAFSALHPNDNAQLLDCMKQTALQRIDNRLQHTMHLLQVPSTNFVIIRDSLLCSKKYLIEFALDHADHIVARVARQYAQVAAQFLQREVTVYCEALAANRTQYDRSRDDSFSLLSNIVSDALGSSVEAEDTSIEESLDRCKRSLRQVATAPLSATELSLQLGGRHLQLEQVVSNCTRFFINLIEKEQQFLCDTFGQDWTILLVDMCAGKTDALLQLISDQLKCISQQSNSAVVGVFIALLTGRNYRSRICKVHTVDPRIELLVRVEKALQMCLLSEIERRSEDLRQHESEACLRRQLDLIGNIAAIVESSREQVDAADICELVQRRLLGLAKDMMACVDEYRCVKRQVHDLGKLLEAVNGMEAIGEVVMEAFEAKSEELARSVN